MDLSPKVNAVGVDDQSWLGSAHGTSSARSITLAVAAFTAATHYPNGYFPSGLPVGKYTSGVNVDKYGPYTAGALDGSQNLAGFTLTATDVPRNTGGNVAAALLDHGRVIVSRLPVAIDTTAQATNVHFVYV